MLAELRNSFASRALAVIVATGAVAAPAQAQADKPLKSTADSEYSRHMSNGVRLFREKNYEAARAEFQAAYKARPSANPLINIALCERALFRYPQAIAALKTAQAQPDIDPKDGVSAQKAIDDMSPLLAHIPVRVTPSAATVTVDGEDQPADAASQPIPLGPGKHTIGAHYEGYASTQQNIDVASGDSGPEVVLTLAPTHAFLRVAGKNAQTAIAIDGEPRGRGEWAGLVVPGPHEITLHTEGEALITIPILAAVGKTMNVSADGKLAESEPAAPSAALPPMVGGYVLVGGDLITQLADATNRSGGSVGIQGGYRLATAVGLQLMYRYSRTGDESTGEARSDAHAVGGGVRLFTKGRKFRFITALQVGALMSGLAQEGVETVYAASVYGSAELGLEANIGHFLLGGVVETVLSSGGMQVPGEKNRGFTEAGLGLRVGYGAW